MDVNLHAVDKLPLITMLAMERACYKKRFMGESYLPHKDNRNR